MKKLFFVSAMICIVGVACKKETSKQPFQPPKQETRSHDYQFSTIGMNEKTGGIGAADLFTNEYISSKLSAQGLSLDESSEIISYDSGQESFVYGKNLIKESNEDQATYKLVFMASNSNITSLPLLVKTKTVDGVKIMTFQSLIDNDLIGGISYKQGKIINIVRGNGDIEAYIQPGDEDKPCPDKTNTFKDCFVCAWNELNNDMLGIITCIANPWCCAAACAIACGAFHTVPNNPNFSDEEYYASINDAVDLQIETGWYTGRVNVEAEGKRYVFLH